MRETYMKIISQQQEEDCIQIKWNIKIIKKIKENQMKETFCIIKKYCTHWKIRIVSTEVYYKIKTYSSHTCSQYKINQVMIQKKFESHKKSGSVAQFLD